nr:MAG TPA: hypothetical protein [Caudoviricetes sp.]
MNKKGANAPFGATYKPSDCFPVKRFDNAFWI